MDVQNEAFVLYAANQAKVEPYPTPSDPESNEVLLKTLKVGICGSDIHYLKEGRCGDFVVKEPMVLGHETVAQVIKVGSEVQHLKLGDRVTTEPAVPCEKCEWCLENQYNLCPDIKCHATPPYHGTLQRYFKHPAKWSFKIPDNVTTEEAALVEPSAVAVHVCRRVNITPGCKVLITGAGPIGLLVLQTAKAFGAGPVAITDINELRLSLAKELGADHTILVKRDTTEDQMIKLIRDTFDNSLPNIALECSGIGVNFRLVMQVTKAGGTCILVGMGPAELQLPIASAASREVKILGSFRYCHCFPQAIELLATKKILAEKMISHRFEFKDCLEAYETAAAGKGIKVLIGFD